MWFSCLFVYFSAVEEATVISVTPFSSCFISFLTERTLCFSVFPSHFSFFSFLLLLEGRVGSRRSFFSLTANFFVYFFNP